MKLEELEKRIGILEDIEAIKKLHVHYVNCLTTTKWAELIDCFAEDGVFDAHAGIARGKKAVAQLFKDKISKGHIGLEGPISIHPIITVDGDKAKGTWLLYIQFAHPRKAPSGADINWDWHQGFYEMEYVRENGSWKISYLKWRDRLTSPIADPSKPLYPWGK